MPNDPETLVGQDMHLWCSVSDGRPLQEANFAIVYRNTKKHHRLPANDSVQLNATTVMLTISNLTNAYDMAMVFCQVERETDFQIIKVGRKFSGWKLIIDLFSDGKGTYLNDMLHSRVYFQLLVCYVIQIFQCSNRRKLPIYLWTKDVLREDPKFCVLCLLSKDHYAICYLKLSKPIFDPVYTSR